VSAASLLGFDRISKSGALGLLPSKQLCAARGPGGLLVRGHLCSIDLGFDIRMIIEEPRE
jgi:hypothetical protein